MQISKNMFNFFIILSARIDILLEVQFSLLSLPDAMSCQYPRKRVTTYCPIYQSNHPTILCLKDILIPIQTKGLFIQAKNLLKLGTKMESGHIVAVPFHGQGHVFPCVELCKRLAIRGVAVTILADPSIAPSLQITAIQAHESLGINIGVLELSLPEQKESKSDEATEQEDPEMFGEHLAKPMEAILRALHRPPVCIISDVMVPWAATVSKKLNIPGVSFFTSGACSLAFEYVIWKHGDMVEETKEPFAVPGFPSSMTLTPSDARHRAPPGPPPDGGGRGRGGRGGPPGRRGRGRGHRPPPPPLVGDGSRRNPPWMNGLKASHGALVNTCRELEAPFMEYVIKETQQPAWAVGPLLPSSFWEEKTPGSLTHDSSVRTTRKSNIDEEQCLQWLDSQAPGSVIYVSFGSEVGPDGEEWTELALGLEAAEKPFILVVRVAGDEVGGEGQDFLPKGFEQQVEGRALVIRGWAPQLLILSHPSTGGFLSHCGWNSTVESLGLGVPLLAWPIRGDQHYNAKLLSAELEVAAMIEVDRDSEAVKMESVVKGVKKLMESEAGLKMREKAKRLKELLMSSVESSNKELDAFLRHVLHSPNQHAKNE